MPQYGLIGKKLGHSFSQQFFSDKFKLEGITASYLNFEIDAIEALPNLLAAHPELAGFNVTTPYKEQIIPYLYHLDPVAAATGAVNTVKITEGKSYGYNTDVYGFRESIKPFLAHGMEYALVLGSGGASKAVATVLRALGMRVTFASRSPRADDHLAYTEINEYAMRMFRLIVNCTPVGTWPNTLEKPPLPYGLITESHFLYDLVYNPAETAFMKEAMHRGAGTTNGLTMLRLQAQKSWEIWNEL